MRTVHWANKSLITTSILLLSLIAAILTLTRLFWLSSSSSSPRPFRIRTLHPESERKIQLSRMFPRQKEEKKPFDESLKGALRKVLFSNDTLPDDPALLGFLQAFHLFPPRPLQRQIWTRRQPHPLNPRVQAVLEEAMGDLTNTQGAFFIECGANDGDFLSNTVELEVTYGWTGLLIEPSATYFPLLKGNARRRKSWTSDVCLSDRPSQLDLYKDTAHEWGSQGGIRLEFAGKDVLNKERYAWDGKADCVPLGSLLMAMNVSQVDFLSLDVEGNEYKVLEVFPFDQIEIKVILVEYLNVAEGKDALAALMKSKGYKERPVSKGEWDFLFIKKED